MNQEELEEKIKNIEEELEYIKENYTKHSLADSIDIKAIVYHTQQAVSDVQENLKELWTEFKNYRRKQDIKEDGSISRWLKKIF